MDKKTEQILLSAAHSLILMGMFGVMLMFRPMPLNDVGKAALQMAPFITAGMFTGGIYLLFRWNAARQYKLLNSVGFWAYAWGWILAFLGIWWIWVNL